MSKKMAAEALLSEQRRLFKAIDNRFAELYEKVGSEIYCGHDDLKGAVYDGCLDVNRYLESPIRIMWILKEHNDMPASVGDHWVTYADCLDDPKNPLAIERFRRNVRYFRSLRLVERASRLLLTRRGSDPVDVFKTISVINIGKCPGENRTPNARIGKLLEWWGEIVREQIHVYRPQLIVVAGNHFDCLSRYLGMSGGLKQFVKGRAKAGLCDYNGIPLVKMQHPSWYGCLEDDWISVLKRAVL